MVNLKFEISAGTNGQIQSVKDLLNDAPTISNWDLAPYIDGYLLSVEGINLQAVNIVQAISKFGLNAEMLFEE